MITCQKVFLFKKWFGYKEIRSANTEKLHKNLHTQKNYQQIAAVNSHSKYLTLICIKWVSGDLRNKYLATIFTQKMP